MDIEGPVLPQRRQMLVGAAIWLAGVALGARGAFADVVTAADPYMTRTSLHQEASFNATPAQIYEIFLSSSNSLR